MATNIYLQTLGDSDYEWPEDRPDIRDWEVKDAQGRRVGYVDELLIDPKTHQLVYLILYLHSDHLHLKGGKVLLPAGLAELHAEDDDVLLPSVSGEQLRALPAFVKGLNSDEEQLICSVLGCCSKKALKKGGVALYGEACFDERLLFRTRRNRLVDEAYRMEDHRDEAGKALRASRGRADNNRTE